MSKTPRYHAFAAGTEQPQLQTGKVTFENPLSGLKSGGKSVFGDRLVMLTAGHKLTSSVDPKRDAAVALRQVWTFKAVFVLEPSVGRLFWR